MFSKQKKWFYISLITIVLSILILYGVALKSDKSENDIVKYSSQNLPAETYLELDLTRKIITSRMGKVKLCDYPYQMYGDSDKTVTDIGFPVGTMHIASVMLLSAAEVLSKDELEVIGEETNLNPEDIQRYIPGVMILKTNEGNLIVIETDCTDPIQYRIEQVKAIGTSVMSVLLGKTTLHITLHADDAMSLLGIVRNNPVMIVQ